MIFINYKIKESLKKITEIRIKGKVYEGTLNIVKGIEEEMKIELESNLEIDWDKTINNEERFFLDRIDEIELTVVEKQELLKPTEEEEILNILQYGVDLDSSPGEDGITARMLLRFMKINSFKAISIRYLNYTRKVGNMGKMRILISIKHYSVHLYFSFLYTKICN
jgi:hypothetical protein